MSRLDFDKPRYSKTAVNRAGEVLVADPTNEESLEVLDYWRSLHVKMLGSDQSLNSVELGIISVQQAFRLKRTVSIIEKLKRNSAMQLARMQDIAGIRNVVNFHYEKAFGFIGEVNEPLGMKPFYQFIADFNKAFLFRAGHQLKKTDDYVHCPKPSGYRAVHNIFEYHHPAKPVCDGLLLEIQFRTKLQHLWAMAVETVGMFYGQALKASQGDEGWLEFFKLASAAISHVEKSPVIADHAAKSFEQIREELHREGTEKSFFSKLAAIKEVDEKYSPEEYDYWLLELNIKKGDNAIYGFKTKSKRAVLNLFGRTSLIMKTARIRISRGKTPFSIGENWPSKTLKNPKRF